MGLKELRERTGLTQTELAALSGVNLRSLQDYEQGHKSMAGAKGETLLRLSRALGYSIEDILADYCIDIEDTGTHSTAGSSRLLAYEKHIRERKTEVVHFPVIASDEIVDMKKLLSLAEIELENAEHNFSKIAINDSHLDFCCYNLQQSIEFSLKFLVEMCGEQYAENHDIRANINILNRLNYHPANEKELRNMASTLYSWETESRYKDSFVAVIADVEDAFLYARALIEEARGMIVRM